MVVSIHRNNAVWQVLTDNVDYQSNPVLTTRIDDAFESGTLKLFWNISTNIEPYTPILIDGKHYVADGKVNKYIGESSVYVHDVNVLEAAAILKCFIIGVKDYSAESPTWGEDYKKFNSLLGQAKRLYPSWTFLVNEGVNQITYLRNNITSSKTYQFGATSTLWDCLNQICVENNKKLKVEFDTTDTSTIKIKLVDVPSATTYSITTANILLNEKSQDRENFCKYLETYASNVVDRNTTTYITWLEPSSEDIALNADTCKLILPSPIESIEEFGVHQLGDITLTITGISNYYDNPSSLFNAAMTYQAASLITCTIDGEQVSMFNEIYHHYLRKYFPNCTMPQFYSGSNCATLQPYVANGDYINVTIPYQLNGMFPMDAVEEKEKWDCRTPQDQSGTLVYTIGSNVIENMNSRYKNDLWNNILGNSRGNFLNYHNSTADIAPFAYPFNQLQVSMGMYVSNNTDPLHWHYWIKYHAITNPFLRDAKEDGYVILDPERVFGRSYDNGANFIDFDKIIPNMHISNETLGKVEQVLELDITSDANPPVAGQSTTFNSETWYISSVITQYKLEAKIATVTLVKNYNKKADSIGVDSQSESTNNPLHNIVTRPIFINTTTTSLPGDYYSWYARFTFYDTSNNQIIGKDKNNNDVSKLISRLTIQSTTEAAIFYCEMLDQMVFAYGKGNYDNGGYYKQIPFVYTDSHAETGYVTIEVGHMDTPQYNNGYVQELPVGSTTFTPVYTFSKIQIDKDAREKLTFTIRFDKTDIK